MAGRVVCIAHLSFLSSLMVICALTACWPVKVQDNQFLVMGCVAFDNLAFHLGDYKIKNSKKIDNVAESFRAKKPLLIMPIILSSL